MTERFKLPDPVVAPVADESQGFPVRRIFCVGRNYAEHAVEMGMDPDRDPPFFFSKFAESIVPDGTAIPYPPGTENYHYEAELVVAIGKSGKDIAVEDANDHIFGYATGLDMTRRDLQLVARKAGRPWDTGKNFADSAPLGLIHEASKVGHFANGAIWLKVNGETKQSADVSDLIWPVPDVIAFLSQLYTLEPGDLIYTGTPAGVGPVVPGDRIEMHIDGLSPLSVTIADPA